MLVKLPHKSILKLSGTEARSFLQGIITQNIELATTDAALYSALLSPQGKMVADFMLVGDQELYMVADSACMDDIVKRLSMYKLRADVTLEVETTLAAAASLNGRPSSLEGWIAFADPRHTKAPWIVIAPQEDLDVHAAGTMESFDESRMQLGLTDGCRDWIINKTLPLEIWADATNGIDFEKGCYVGQEVTARTHYRKAIKKRMMIASALLPVPLPAQGVITAGEIEIGTFMSTTGPLGLALIRVADWAEAVDDGYVILSDDTPLVLHYPDYVPEEYMDSQKSG